MNISFLGQGLESESKNSVGNLIIKLLQEDKFHTFIGISAFASEAGVYGLSRYLNSAKRNFDKLALIVGVDQNGTSKEALEEILNLNIDSYIFYQEEQPIFHPKIYLFEGDDEVKIILGSSNLTGRGLFTNIESSLLIEFATSDKEGLALLSELNTYYKTLFDFSDPNIFKISNALISEFILNGIVPDEASRRKSYTKKTPLKTQSSSKNTIKIPKRIIPTIPNTFPIKSKTTTINQTTNRTSLASAKNKTSSPQSKELIWQKVKLSSSDVQNVPSGTAITGNLKFAQARFKRSNKIIDQTTYFRNQVFKNLDWAKTKANSNTYEESFCTFEILILGNSVGTFTLKLSHDPVRIAGQGNTPTWLHWGHSLIPLLQQNNLAGKTLNLYFTNNSFLIEIS